MKSGTSGHAGYGQPHIFRIRGLGCLLAATVLTSAAHAVDVPRYDVYEQTFQGPQFSPGDKVADVDFYTEWQHESGSPTYKIYGFYDGDGAGGAAGNVFIVRFCPTETGTWTLISTHSSAPELNGQNEGTTVNCIPSDNHGFWIPEGRWFGRSDGTHPYMIGNCHYCLPYVPTYMEDIRGNIEYFNKVRFMLAFEGEMGTCKQYGHAPFFTADGQPSHDSIDASRINPAFFRRTDDLIKETLPNDFICDLYFEGGKGISRNDNYVKYCVARFAGYPNVWLQPTIEYDGKFPGQDMIDLGNLTKSFLTYPTPLTVISNSKWDPELNGDWHTHIDAQAHVKGLVRGAEITRIEAAKVDNNKPVNIDETGPGCFQNHHCNEQEVMELQLGIFLGGGYSGTGYKYGKREGPYCHGNFDPNEQTAADNMKWKRDMIDKYVYFWHMEPQVGPFKNAGDMPYMGWENNQYVIGTNSSRNMSIDLPAGSWTVRQFDFLSKEEKVLSRDAKGSYSFSTPGSLASMTLFTKDGVVGVRSGDAREERALLRAVAAPTSGAQSRITLYRGSTAPARVTVFDVSGSAVATRRLSGASRVTIPVQSSSGILYLRVSSEGHVGTHRVVTVE